MQVLGGENYMEQVRVSGITPVEAYPECISVRDSKQCVEKLDLCIPRVKPDIEYVEELQVNVKIGDVKKIDTILGEKLVVQGKILIKAIYTADNAVQSLHSSHWERDFAEYILFEKGERYRKRISVKRVFAGVEDISIIEVDSRGINVSIIYVLCPEMANCRNCNEVYED